MENNAENVRSQMRKGVLEYCILSILDKKEAYASSILDELKSITEKGRQQLLDMDAAWQEIVDTIKTIKEK